MEDDECSGWPSISRPKENIEKTSQLVQEDHQLSVWMIRETISFYKDCNENYAWESQHEKSMCQDGSSGTQEQKEHHKEI